MEAQTQAQSMLSKQGSGGCKSCCRRSHTYGNPCGPYRREPRLEAPCQSREECSSERRKEGDQVPSSLWEEGELETQLKKDAYGGTSWRGGGAWGTGQPRGL